MNDKYYHTKESVEEYIHLAKDASGKELILIFKEYLPDNAFLLEIGSGPGTDWNILCNDYRIIGSDNSEEFINHLQTTHPEGEFLKLDAVSIITENKFDGIYSNKVLHHLKDEELISSIKRQFEILNTDGMICHSFWKGEGAEIFKGMFVNYHVEKELRNLFEQYFDILYLQPYDEFEANDSLLLIARKKKNL